MNLEIVPYDKQWVTNFKTIKQVISKSLNKLIIDMFQDLQPNQFWI